MACWSEPAQVGGGGGERGAGPLAFTSSPRIPKFFSNLQLLDVEANHQRGSPCADSPRRPLPPPNLLPPLERRLIQASSLIHEFIYYFIGCV